LVYELQSRIQIDQLFDMVVAFLKILLFDVMVVVFVVVGMVIYDIMWTFSLCGAIDLMV